MTKKEFVNSKGETWEYEETEEMRKAVERLTKLFVNLKRKMHLIMELENETTNT